MSVIISKDGVNRTVKDIYEPVDGVNRKIKHRYHSSGGINRIVYTDVILDKTYLIRDGVVDIALTGGLVGDIGTNSHNGVSPLGVGTLTYYDGYVEVYCRSVNSPAYAISYVVSTVKTIQPKNKFCIDYDIVVSNDGYNRWGYYYNAEASLLISKTTARTTGIHTTNPSSAPSKISLYAHGAFNGAYRRLKVYNLWLE